MSLSSLKNISSLDAIRPLKPLTIIRVLNIPHKPELMLLAANLLYQSKRILDKEMNCKKGLCVDHYIYKAIAIMNIVDDYQNKHISFTELRTIKKEFGLNGLYK